MLMKNLKIYELATNLNQQFQDKSLKLPIKVNFFLQKNKNLLTTLAQEIEKERIAIVEQYGQYNAETNQYTVPSETMEEALKSLEELFGIEQDVNINMVDIDALSNAELTTGQMECLLFMIND
jgi:hypothetical protein